jgi:hypothetical protein
MGLMIPGANRDKTKVASFVAASVTDKATGEVLSVTGSWHDAQGREITDPDEIARLDMQYHKKDYAAGLSVAYLDNDDKTWIPATVSHYHGAGTWILVNADGGKIGVPSDRIKEK